MRQPCGRRNSNIPIALRCLKYWRATLKRQRYAVNGVTSISFGRCGDRNPKLNNTQFADYHGHGWNFRAVFKKDRKGNLLDDVGDQISHDDPEKWAKAVHMKSIHIELGMHCVDCHFSQDAHGNGFIHGEVANAIEIRCVDCHGDADAYPTLQNIRTRSASWWI